MNGLSWTIEIVDPYNKMLVDRTNRRTVGTTDPVSQTIYLSSEIYGNFFIKVLIHELAHCAMVSFNLLPQLHKMVKKQYWIQAEEWVCNFIADYGFTIFSIAYKRIGFDAWKLIPKEYQILYQDGGMPYGEY